MTCRVRSRHTFRIRNRCRDGLATNSQRPPQAESRSAPDSQELPAGGARMFSDYRSKLLLLFGPLDLLELQIALKKQDGGHLVYGAATLIEGRSAFTHETFRFGGGEPFIPKHNGQLSGFMQLIGKLA